MIERRLSPKVEVSHSVLYDSDRHVGPQVCSTIDVSTGETRLERPYGLTAGDGLGISMPTLRE
jgi:hypothetical protein